MYSIEKLEKDLKRKEPKIIQSSVRNNTQNWDDYFKERNLDIAIFTDKHSKPYFIIINDNNQTIERLYFDGKNHEGNIENIDWAEINRYLNTKLGNDKSYNIFSSLKNQWKSFNKTELINEKEGGEAEYE